MDDKQINDLLAPPPREPDAATLATEEQLWLKLKEKLADEARHRDYVGFALKNNLIKNALRRYGEIVDAKEQYPIEDRRLAKKYQKSLVDVMFFTPRRQEPRKVNSLELLGMIMLMLGSVIGLYMMFDDSLRISPTVLLVLRLLFPVCTTLLVVMFWKRLKKAKSLIGGPENR